MNPLIYSNQAALSTQEGLSITYDYAKASTKFLMTWETENFLKALGKGKEQKPRLDAFSGSQKGLFLDFDKLEGMSAVMPEAFSSDWDGVARWMNLALGNHGCMFRSASKKVKVFIPINTDSLTQAEAKAYVKKNFPRYASLVDMNGGLRYSFIDKEAYQTLKQYLKSMEYVSAVDSNTKLFSKKREVGYYNKRVTEPLKWNLFNGVVPSSILNMKKNDTLVKVFNFIAGSFYLSTSHGVAVPQEKVAEMFGVSQMAISNALSRLIKEGVIVKTSQWNHKAGLASKYRFTGFYLGWAKKQLEDIKTKKPTARFKLSKEAVEASFKPGEWNKLLFIYTRFFNSSEAYYEAVKAIPGFSDKAEREVQMVSAWKSHYNRKISNQTIKEKVA